MYKVVRRTPNTTRVSFTDFAQKYTPHSFSGKQYLKCQQHHFLPSKSLCRLDVRCVVVFIFSTLLCVSLAVIPTISVGLDQELSMPEGSHALKYFEVNDFLCNYVKTTSVIVHVSLQTCIISNISICKLYHLKMALIMIKYLFSQVHEGNDGDWSTCVLGH